MLAPAVLEDLKSKREQAKVARETFVQRSQETRAMEAWTLAIGMYGGAVLDDVLHLTKVKERHIQEIAQLQSELRRLAYTPTPVTEAEVNATFEIAKRRWFCDREEVVELLTIAARARHDTTAPTAHWRTDLDNAPKTGKCILLRSSPSFVPYVGYWSKENGWVRHDGRRPPYSPPVGWCSLPGEETPPNPAVAATSPASQVADTEVVAAGCLLPFYQPDTVRAALEAAARARRTPDAGQEVGR